MTKTPWYPACPECNELVAVTHARSRIKHNADGTHTVTTSKPRKATETKSPG